MNARALALVGLLGALGCSRDVPAPAEGESSPARPSFDAQQLRAPTTEGIEAALTEAGPRRSFERAVEGLAAEAPVVEASERALARIGSDPEVAAASDRFFAEVQDTPSVRAALVAHAKAHPELELAELSASFVTVLDARLTRPELAAAVSEVLGAKLSAAGPPVGRTLLVEAGAAEALAEVLVARLDDPGFRRELDARVGASVAGDPEALAEHLRTRVSDPRRMADLVIDFVDVLADAPAGHELIAGILDHERCAVLAADSLRRLAAEPAVREASRALLEDALAEAEGAGEDPLVRFEAGLRALLGLPVVVEELETFVELLAREPELRAAVADYTRRYGERESLDGILLELLD